MIRAAAGGIGEAELLADVAGADWDDGAVPEADEQRTPRGVPVVVVTPEGAAGIETLTEGFRARGHPVETVPVRLRAGDGAGRPEWWRRLLFAGAGRSSEASQ
jgi:hypothetical protein